MSDVKNSEITRSVLKGLFKVAGRRTSQHFVTAVLGAIIRTLENNYDFLKHVKLKDDNINVDDVIYISTDTDNIETSILCKGIEAIVRVVYMDLRGQGGLFFIKELKTHAGENVITEMKNNGVDLELMEIEQQYLNRQLVKNHLDNDKNLSEEEKKERREVSLLGYAWDKVSKWDYDSNKKEFVVYGENGKEVDKLNLDSIIKNYVGALSDTGMMEKPSDYGIEIDISEKEYQLLKMMHSDDVDADTVMKTLDISMEELEKMTRNLLKVELLQYVSNEEIELTEIGINYLSERESKQ
jgi:hypothetical protein